MKRISILTIALSCCIACNGPKNEATGDNDTIVIETDTIVQQNYSEETTISTTTYDSAENAEGELIEEKGKIVYKVYWTDDRADFLMLPYDFVLDADSIEQLLGKEDITLVNKEGSSTTITFKDTEISFGDSSRWHEATIRTPLLPLKNGIKIGMKKKDFLQAMQFDDINASKATVYEFRENDGGITISFRTDTLYFIDAWYEAGLFELEDQGA